MKNEAFRDYVDLYSADLSRWPQDLVKQALALMETSAEAKAYFDEALALDGSLRSLDGAHKSQAKLEARIMQQISGMAQEDSPPVAEPGFFGSGIFKSEWKPAYIFAPGGGLLAAVLIGFFVGFQQPSTMPAENHLLVDAMVFSEEIMPAEGEDEDIFDSVVF